MPGLPSDITHALRTLCRGCEGIEAVLAMSIDGNRFSRALTDLHRLAVEQKIPIAIVGGLAAIRYGYPAATQDIDIAVCKDQLEELVRFAPRYDGLGRAENQFRPTKRSSPCRGGATTRLHKRLENPTWVKCLTTRKYWRERLGEARLWKPEAMSGFKKGVRNQ